MTRSEAWSLLEEFVEARGLPRHMLAVEAAMRFYAERLAGDAENWGDPETPGSTCENYFPIIFVNGDANIQGGGSGQGILLVAGDLDLRGNFAFYGVIIVQGDFETQGNGNRVFGGVLAGNATLGAQTLTGGSEVQFSSCAIERAIFNSSLTRARRLPNRSWVDVSYLVY